MSPADSDTGINNNSIERARVRERIRDCSVHVSTQEAMSCPPFSPKGVLTVYTPTIRLNRPALLKMCQRCREKRRKEVLEVT